MFSQVLVSRIVHVITVFALLQDHRVFRAISIFATEMFYFAFIFIPKIVKPQAIFFNVNNVTQFGLKRFALSRIQQALKYRVLYPLPIIYTLSGNMPQTSASFSGFCIHIISNYYQHFIISIKKEDIRQYRRGWYGQAIMPAHIRRVPREFFHRDKDE